MKRQNYGTMLKLTSQKFVKTGKDEKLLDFLQALCRSATHSIAENLNLIFQADLVPYRILGDPLTLMPIATAHQAEQFLEDFTATSSMMGTNTHILRAAEALNKKNYSGSVRESIHSVESTIKQLSGDDDADLSKGLKLLEKNLNLHQALSKALQSLYGWTSDEKGVRHALINPADSVTEGMALFMFSACTAFSAWLVREQRLKASGE